MTLDTPDALLFDQSLTRVAGELAALGDTDDLDHRRAAAVGILADPQYALDLMSGREGAHPSRAGAGARTSTSTSPPTTCSATGSVRSRSRSSAPPPPSCCTEWLARQTATGGRVTLRPVLDLGDQSAVDQHDPPDAMRELVVLRDAHCVFPGCRRDSRHCDLDHITPYIPMDQGGPPGQTHPGNLAPLCRTHHRIKTFTAWDYKPRDDGSYTWTAPTGHQYDVAPLPTATTPPGRRRT